jgi:hypothetical protein
VPSSINDVGSYGREHRRLRLQSGRIRREQSALPLPAFGESGIVASICPKNVTPVPSLGSAEDPDYGYNPTISALGDRLSGDSDCIPRPLPYDSSSDGDRILCQVIESALELLQENGSCGAAAGIDCTALCSCEVQQLEGKALAAAWIVQQFPRAWRGSATWTVRVRT